MVDSVGVDGGSIADFGSGVCEINARPYSRPDSTPAPPKSKLKSWHAILRELGVQNKRPLLQKNVWVNYNIDVWGSRGAFISEDHYLRSGRLFRKHRNQTHHCFYGKSFFMARRWQARCLGVEGAFILEDLYLCSKRLLRKHRNRHLHCFYSR